MNKNSRKYLLMFVTLLIGAVTGFSAPVEISRAKLLEKSDIVFVGTVVKARAVSFAGVPESPRTMVVQVDAVLEKPGAVSLAKGDKVTVEVKEPSQLREGLQATFYTDGWIFGDGIAVREVGHEMPADPTDPLGPGQAEQKQAEVKKGRKEVSDAELRTKIQAADMVIVGRVKTVRPWTVSSEAARPAPVSEHDANWQEAIIQVESSIKGGRTNQNIVVRFPNSMDVLWYGMPKFKEGQEGTFILQKDMISGTPKARLGGAEVGTYAAMDAESILSKEEAQRVRALAEK